MKKAAEICIVICMIVFFETVIAIIVGLIALRRLTTAVCKEELIGVGILTLLLCSIPGGILMLCMRDEDLMV